MGHSSSVRCLAVNGDVVVSGSYDYTAMVQHVESQVNLDLEHIQRYPIEDVDRPSKSDLRNRF